MKSLATTLMVALTVNASAAILNVQDYGAVGDGVTNDTTSIGNAAAALVDGDCLYFPPGTYLVTGTTTIEPNHVTVCADNGVLYPFAASTTALIIDGNSCTVCELEIAGAGATSNTSMYGIDVYGSGCMVRDCNVHDIYRTAYVSRGADNAFVRCRAADVGWDLGLCRGGSVRTLWQDCYGEQVGRSLVACDDDAEVIQVIGCYGYNCGNTQYTTDNHHNILHFEDCNGVLVRDVTVRYDGDHDYCSNTDANLKAVVARYDSGPMTVEGLTVIVESSFDTTLTTIPLIADYGYDETPLYLTNVKLYNWSDEMFSNALLVADQIWQDVYIHGAFRITQSGATSSIMRMDRVVVDGNDQSFDFYYPRYGYDPNGIITNCRFENIDGWALIGHFDNWKIVNNVFRDVNGVNLYAQYNDASNKPNDTLIQGNLFDDCDNVLSVYWATTAASHRNMFYDNVIAGKSENIYLGTSPGTSVYWRGNRATAGASWATLATNNAMTIYEDLSSQYDRAVDVNSVASAVTSLDPYGVTVFDSSGGAMYPALYDADAPGQIVELYMKTAGSNVDVWIEHHVTSDPEVMRFDSAGDSARLMWDGTDWIVLSSTGVSYP